MPCDPTPCPKPTLTLPQIILKKPQLDYAPSLPPPPFGRLLNNLYSFMEIIKLLQPHHFIS